MGQQLLLSHHLNNERLLTALLLDLLALSLGYLLFCPLLLQLSAVVIAEVGVLVGDAVPLL